MSPARRRTASVNILAAAVTVIAAWTPARSQDLRFAIATDRLDNGLEVMVIEDHAVPAISWYTFFHVGSRNEHPGRTGISHLFEHMMFNGAKKYGPGEFDRALESRGGVSNAFTDEDVTGYYESFPSDALDLVADMESDRMAGLRITQESLDHERGVVQEERRLRVDNDNQGSMEELLNATAYLAHPYGWPVVGWVPDLDAITVDDCRDYFRVQYAPNNVVLILAGDVEPGRAFTLVRRAFSGIPAQPRPPAVVADEPKQNGERRAVLRKAAQAPAVACAFHVPAIREGRDVFTLDLIETILGSGESSRLTRRLVRELKLASSVGVSNSYRVDPSLFIIMAEARPGVKVGDLEKALEAELALLGKEPVGDRELQKARNLRTMSLLRPLKTSSGKAQQLGVSEIYLGAYGRLFD